jgi:NAD(P)H-flavin reductase
MPNRAEPQVHRRDPLVPDAWTVVARRRDLADTVTLHVAPGDGSAPAWTPGQFQMLYAFGVGEVPISIAGDDGAGGLLHTIRDVGAVTRALAALEPGAMLGARGPFGSAWPLAAARGGDLVIAAGGIGLAPLRGAIEHTIAARDDFDRVTVLIGARRDDQLLYLDDYPRWRAARIAVEVTVDHAAHGWAGHVGVITPLVRLARFDPARTHALICGPEVMMRFVAHALVEAGIDAPRIHVSMERNMQCAIGHCGHCQLGPELLCRDGPVLPWARIEPLLRHREL